jgi:hypothetical protein
MNCQAVASLIAELAREGATGAVDQDVLRHASECTHCRSRLDVERALNNGLRAFAASVSGERASASIERALLAKFREYHKSEPVEPAIPRRWRLRLPLRWAVAAGLAIVLAALAIGVSRMEPVKQAKPRDAVISPEAPREAPPARENREPDRQNIPAPSQRLNRRPAELHEVASKVSTRRPKASQPATPETGSAQAVEIASEFIPLMQSDMSQLDGGHVLRVELPRSALASFGLPMSTERESERIKADVVVGNDGLARAIRFVQ